MVRSKRGRPPGPGKRTAKMAKGAIVDDKEEDEAEAGEELEDEDEEEEDEREQPWDSD